MSYFAILKSANHAPLEVTHCHINLWLMRDHSERRTFLDVGIGVRGDILEGRFRVAVPLRTATASGCRSLHAETRKVANATLIWGEHVAEEATHHTLAIGRNNPNKLYVAEAQVSKVEKLASDSGEVWDVSFIRPKPGTRQASPSVPTYLRLRFEATDSTMLVQEIDDGLIVDLRIADIRNVPEGHHWEEIAPTIVELKGARIFVIAPSAQQLVAHYPSFQYIRVLESKVWNEYLAPQPDTKMTVFYWKKSEPKSQQQPHKKNAPKATPPVASSKEEAPIAEDNPFRGFISLKAPGRTQTPSSAIERTLQTPIGLGVGITAALATHFVILAATRYRDPLWNWLTHENALFSLLNNATLLGGPISLLLTVLWLRYRSRLSRAIAHWAHKHM